METRQKRTKIVGGLALAGLLVLSLFAVAGNLEPTAPPGPTMKTLDQVEPRIPISQADIPKTINTPGSYYLTGDVNSAGTAITIIVDDVTIDLAGFALVGPGSGTNYGIYMNARSNVEIRNGTVRNFGYGIYENSSNGRGHRVIDVRAIYNGSVGIYLSGAGSGHLVKGCTASNNGTSATNVYGIYAGSGCTVTGNTAHNNGTSATNLVYGISAASGSTVTGNTVYRNGESAIGTVCGIYAGSGSTVTGNTACNNGGSATAGTVYGIYANTGCTVTTNTAYYNGVGAPGNVFGIYLAGNSLVDQNTAYSTDGTNMNKPANCTYGVNYAP